MFDNDGSLFCQRLDNEGVKYSFVWDKGSVRVNYKIVDNRSMLTEINDRGETVTETKQQELINLVKSLAPSSSVVVMSGSLPKGVDNDYYQKLVKVVPKGVKTIVDAEGLKLMNALKEGVYMVKPNLAELENIIGSSIKTKLDMLKGCNKLLDAGAERVLLSLGGEGAILTNGTNAYFCKSANVAVNSTVGAGDSMVAAVSVMTERGMDIEETLRCAVAAGTASVTTPGTNLFYRDKYEEIYQKIHVEKF
jgi:1-phosphofructokinase